MEQGRRRTTRRDSNDSDPETNNNDNERMSVSDLSRQVDKLTRDLQRRDRELEDEKQENTRILERVKKLERDKLELRREAEDFRDEANEYKKALEEVKYKRKPVDEDLKEKYEVTIQQKNHEIQQLLDDLEKLEGEKGDLGSKLNELKDSLEEATSQLENITQDHVQMNSRLLKSEAKVKEIQDEKVVLEIKLKDLLSFKQRHDEYLENLCSAVDVRVDVWKKMMFQKEEEIDRLNVKLSTLANQIPSKPMSEIDKNMANQLKLKLVDRESTITELQEKLGQATQDLESATEHITALNNKLQYVSSEGGTGEDSARSALENLESKLGKYKYQLHRKEDQVGQLEKEIEEKSKELTNLSARMHNYETGVYGLSEAIMEIKELKTQLRIRNNQIEAMTQEINELHLKLNDIIDENDMLRSRIDVSSLDIKSETKQFTSNRTTEIQALKSKITELEEQLVSIKSKNYNIRKHVTQQTDEFGKNIATKLKHNDWKDKYDVVLEENLELRKGLQEILETMQRMTDDEKSDILIESPVLENLLREMSARGLIHYPYGISSFHLKVCNLEGKNSQLREEIHRLKQEEKNNRNALIKAQATIQSLQDKIVTLSSMSPSSDTEGQPMFSDSIVENLQAEIESLHGQIKHLHDVLQFESSVEKSDQCVQTSYIEEPVEYELAPVSSDHLVFPTSLETLNRFVQTEELLENVDEIERQKDLLEQRLYQLETDLESLQYKFDDQKIILDAKDKVINEIKLLSFTKSGDDYRSVLGSGHGYELQEALNISRETVTSLQERLKSKEDNLNQYRQLLSELRNEMTAATNRHVQEMRALQLTIHQQQQAFTRMKTTLSHPVKDTLNIEGTIQDQLTRIHELEDEVSELQHAVGNVASQLTAARSEAHRWRCTADARLKELDINRDTKQHNIERSGGIHSLREKLRQQEGKIAELETETTRLKSTKDSIHDLVAAIKNEHYMVAASAGQQKTPAVVKDLKEKLTSKEKEIGELQGTNKDLLQKVTTLQARLSKLNASNRQTGHSVEMEQLRAKYFTVEQEKNRLEEDLKILVKARDIEDEKKRKAIESMTKWEEAKKWKKSVEKLELQIDALKKDNERLTQINKTLRSNVNRLDKLVTDFKRIQPPVKSILKSPEISHEVVENLKIEIQDLNDLLEKTEFEGREKTATLDTEIKCLKERIVAQERQLAAYQVAQKGDPKVVSEIEKMATKESDLQKVINALEEDNLHLKLQIEQLRMDTPRLRDRVQQLQKLVEILKSERSEPYSGTRSHSQKSLSELERTITALKQLIDKLQSENKRLKIKPSLLKSSGSTSSEALKATLENLMKEKKQLIDQLATLEDEKKKFHRMYMEVSTSVDTLQMRLQDAEKRAESSEMKLRIFLGKLGDQGGDGQEDGPVYQRMRFLEEALERKAKLLDDAKLALRQAAGSNK